MLSPECECETMQDLRKRSSKRPLISCTTFQLVKPVPFLRNLIEALVKSLFFQVNVRKLVAKHAHVDLVRSLKTGTCSPIWTGMVIYF